MQRDQPPGVPPLALTGERTLPDVPAENYWYRVEANPEAFEHASLKYTRPGVRFVRDLAESHSEPCDAIVFLQTIEHLEDPVAVLRRFRELARDAVYVSTPNVLTLAPPGAERSDNPWHVREYRPEEFRELCARVFDRVELLGLFHARKLRAHELALRAGIRLGERFYDRFTPAITARDFALRDGPLERALDLVAVLRP